MLPGESVWRRNRSSEPPGDGGEKSLLHGLLAPCKLLPLLTEPTLPFRPALHKIQPREVSSSLHCPAAGTVCSDPRDRCGGAPKVGGRFGKSENVQYVVWAHR